MTSRAAVSVLIPCFNAERYLGETLESALKQSLPPVEILVVDDRSTDASRAIAEKYAPAVRVLTNVGQGASAARNHASANASGEFFQFLDADDLLEPTALATRVDALQRSGANVAVSDWQRLVERDGTWMPGKIESGHLPDSTDPADLSVFKGFWAPPAAVLYRRTVCDRIHGWRENLPVIQDHRFLLDAARLGGRFAHVQGVGARYRQHAHSSLSSRSSPRFWRDVLENTREMERLWTSDGQFDPAHRAAVAGAYAHCAHVGFSTDRALFHESYQELRRFPEQVPSRLVRAGAMLTKFAGYGAAHAILSRFSRSQAAG